MQDLTNLKNRKVLVRADFNVPLKNSRIADDRKIRASLPTIKLLLKNNCSVVLCSHLGRPKGGFDKNLSLKSVAGRLQKLLGRKVFFADECVGRRANRITGKLRPRDVCLLENLRFCRGEKKNSRKFAENLAEHAQAYVNDAFGSSHRAHASIAGVPEFLPSFAGLLLQKEIFMLSRVLNPKKPLVVLLGGKKVSDKIGLIIGLAKKADKILVGSAMVFSFLKAKGFETGKSIGAGEAGTAKKILEKFRKKIVLAEDFAAAKDLDSKARIVPAGSIPENMACFDIGPKTISRFSEILGRANTVFWNGPVGVFEKKRFAKGTDALAKVIAGLDAVAVAGGGDTARAIGRLEKRFTWVSTGGGAALEFLAGKKLAGIEALEKSRFRQA